MPSIKLTLPPTEKVWGGSDSSSENWSANASCLEVRYVAKDCASGAGMNWRCSPPTAKFPATVAKLSYSVYVPRDIDFVQCGKLPGLWMGDTGAGGGEHLKNGGSCRVMWRSEDNGTSAHLVAYIYIPTQVGNGKYRDQDSAEYDAQGPGFKKLWHWTPGGDDLFRDLTPKLWLHKGTWNTVSIEVGLNSPTTQCNGWVELTVNGQSKKFDKMKWRSDPTLRLEGILMSSWFGGGDPDQYGPDRKQKMLFKDFGVVTS